VSDTRLKPLVKIQRPPFLAKRQRVVVLTRALEEALFRHADVISEGGTRLMPKVGNTYFGSTMIAIAFDRLADETHQKFTRHTRATLVNVVEGSVRVRLRCMRMARAEAVRRVTDARLGTVLCELRVHEDGPHLRIDVDLEAPMRVSSRATRANRP
jgi:hypothetical protein